MYEPLASQSQTLPLLTSAFPHAGWEQPGSGLGTPCTHPGHQLLLSSPQLLQGHHTQL